MTADAGSLIGESPEVRGFWLCEAVWVKDGPGCARLCAEAMVNGKTQVDMHSFDISRFYPHQKEKEFVKTRAFENSQTIYTPAVHPREPYITQREMFVSPFYEEKKSLVVILKMRLQVGKERLLIQPIGKNLNNL